jgi:hypothetical protein
MRGLDARKELAGEAERDRDRETGGVISSSRRVIPRTNSIEMSHSIGLTEIMGAKHVAVRVRDPQLLLIASGLLSRPGPGATP